MKKYIHLFLFCSVIIGTIYINYNLLEIKTVQATKIKKVNYTEQIPVSGLFENKNSTEIIMAYPLYIKEVFVTENSFVYSGQALFSIDKKIMAEILSASNDAQEFGNTENALLKNYIKTDINTSSIMKLPDIFYSPCNGYVSGLEISPSSLSMPDSNLVTIIPDNSVTAKISLSQFDYGKISVGDTISVSSVAFPEKKYSGRILNDNAVVNRQHTLAGETITVNVFASIDNPDDRIAEGMQINGHITLNSEDEINALSYDYIFQDETGQYVFVLENGRAKKYYISTGIETAEYTQLITEFPADTLFLKGNIKEGQLIIAEVIV